MEVSPDLLEKLNKDYPNSEFHNLDNVQEVATGKCEHTYCADEVIGVMQLHVCTQCGLGEWRPAQP